MQKNLTQLAAFALMMSSAFAIEILDPDMPQYNNMNH